MTLNWDILSNFKIAGDVTGYDIRYRRSDSRRIAPYHEITINAQETSIVFKGLHSMVIYDFEVRARNAVCKGEWSRTSEYIGTCGSLLTIAVLFRDSYCREVDSYCIQMTLLYSNFVPTLVALVQLCLTHSFSVGHHH